jgi:hypothetical protein
MAKNNKGTRTEGSVASQEATTANNEAVRSTIINAVQADNMVSQGIDEVVKSEITAHTAKQSEFVGDDKIQATYDVKTVEVVGDKMVLSFEKGKITVPHTTKKLIGVTITGIGKVLLKINKIQDQPGRPVDPTSARQKKLAEQAARATALIAQGLTPKQGRPTDPNSARQARLGEQASKIISATMETEAFKELIAGGMSEDDALRQLIEAGQVVKPSRGRPVDENSKRQEVLAQREQRMAELGVDKLQRGRPKTKDEEMLVIDGGSLMFEETDVFNLEEVTDAAAEQATDAANAAGETESDVTA